MFNLTLDICGCICAEFGACLMSVLRASKYFDFKFCMPSLVTFTGCFVYSFICDLFHELKSSLFGFVSKGILDCVGIDKLKLSALSRLYSDT